MSFYLASVDGYLGDVATNSGLKKFRTWAENHAGAATRAFLEAGETMDPAALAAELATLKAADADDEDIRVTLLRLAQRAEGILILSNGTAPEGD